MSALRVCCVVLCCVVFCVGTGLAISQCPVPGVLGARGIVVG
jgi:hypothetical protein